MVEREAFVAAPFSVKRRTCNKKPERIRSSPPWWSGAYILPAILVVEDEAFLNLEISDALSEKGYEVIAVANADDAISVLETRNDIRTIFTDINMPGSMDGLKLAAAVRDRWPPVNIIVTSGRKAPRADELPAKSLFIAKPYQSAEVLEAVRSLENPAS